MKRIRWFLLASIIIVAGVLGAAAWDGAAVQAQGNNPGVVVFTSDRTGDFEIYTLDPQTGQMTRLTQDPAADIEPMWSPDGSFIAFSSDRDGDFELYVMRSDGTAVQQLTNNAGEDRQPRWQPGGKFLAYSSDTNGRWDIFVISVETLQVSQITNDAFDERGPVGETVVVEGGMPVPSAPGVVEATVIPVQPTVAPPTAFVNRARVNVRANPGEGASIVTTLTSNTQVEVVGRWTGETWLQIRTSAGIVGWVYAPLLMVTGDLSQVPVVNAPFIAPPPTLTPVPPTPQPTVIPVAISFSADKTTINSGECAVLSWSVSGIKEVYYQNMGVPGAGSQQECPTTNTTYNLRVVRLDGVVDNRYITITVNP